MKDGGGLRTRGDTRYGKRERDVDNVRRGLERP